MIRHSFSRSGWIFRPSLYFLFSRNTFQINQSFLRAPWNIQARGTIFSIKIFSRVHFFKLFDQPPKTPSKPHSHFQKSRKNLNPRSHFFIKKSTLTKNITITLSSINITITLYQPRKEKIPLKPQLTLTPFIIFIKLRSK